MSIRRQRGFALVIVVICSVAMVAIAVALAFTSGANRIVSVKGSAIDQSETIALAGMERAVAYAERVADVERDFDLLLDPDLDANCATDVAAQVSPQSALDASGNPYGVPRFSDGSNESYEGRRYKKVAFNEGAYLIRYDDDDDDREDSTLLAPFTGNRPNSGCTEGTTFGDNNPFRDRNRAVWITVIGIYPGADPAKARHRTSLRRYHISTGSLPGPAIFINGNIDIDGALDFCSNIGDIAAGGSMDLGGGKACGHPVAAGAVSGTSSSAAATCPVGHCTAFQSPTGGVPLPAQTAHAPNALFWFNTTQPECNFYVVRDAAVSGLFFFDPSRDAVCSALVANTNPATAMPSPTTVAQVLTAPAGTADRCWVPVILGTPGGVAVNIMGWPATEVNGANWRPDASAPISGTLDTTLAGTLTGSAIPAMTATRPNWGTCKTLWKGTGGSPVDCTSVVGDQCNGVTAAAHVDATGNIVFNDTMALPAGTYRFEAGNELASTIKDAAGALPSNDNTPAAFGLGTFLVDGNFTADTDFVLGYGQEHAPFASLVARGNIGINSGRKPVFGGSLISTGGNITFDNGSFPGTETNFYGMIIGFTGNLHVDTGSKLKVDYDNDLFGGAKAVPAAATMSRTIR